MPQNSGTGTPGTSLLLTVSVPKDGPTVPGPGGDLVTGAGIKTFTDPMMQNFATIGVNLRDIWTAGWVAQSGHPVRITVTGLDPTNNATITLGTQTTLIVGGDATTGIVVADSGFVTWRSGTSAEWQANTSALWDAESSARWAYGAQAQSFTSFQFSNGLAITGAAIGGSIIALTAGGTHGVSASGSTVVIVDPSDPSVTGVWFAMPFNGSALSFQINGGGGTQASSGGVMALATFSITNAPPASPTVYHSPAHGLSTGNTVIIQGIQGNTLANTSSGSTVTVIDANTFSIALNSLAGGAYTSGGQGGVVNSHGIATVSSTNIIVATSAAHGLSNGDQVIIDSMVSSFSPSPNGAWIVAVPPNSTTQIVLFNSNATGSYGSGGFLSPFSADQGASVEVLRGDVRFTGDEQLPAASAPPLNSLSAPNVCKAWGRITITHGTPPTVALSNTGPDSAHNIPTVTIGTSPLWLVTVTFATPMSTGGGGGNYALTFGTRFNGSIGANPLWFPQEHGATDSDFSVICLDVTGNPIDVTTIDLTFSFHVDARQ